MVITPDLQAALQELQAAKRRTPKEIQKRVNRRLRKNRYRKKHSKRLQNLAEQVWHVRCIQCMICYKCIPVHPQHKYIPNHGECLCGRTASQIDLHGHLYVYTDRLEDAQVSTAHVQYNPYTEELIVLHSKAYASLKQADCLSVNLPQFS